MPAPASTGTLARSLKWPAPGFLRIAAHFRTGGFPGARRRTSAALKRADGEAAGKRLKRMVLFRAINICLGAPPVLPIVCVCEQDLARPGGDYAIPESTLCWR